MKCDVIRFWKLVKALMKSFWKPTSSCVYSFIGCHVLQAGIFYTPLGRGFFCCVLCKSVSMLWSDYHERKSESKCISNRTVSIPTREWIEGWEKNEYAPCASLWAFLFYHRIISFDCFWVTPLGGVCVLSLSFSSKNFLNGMDVLIKSPSIQLNVQMSCCCFGMRNSPVNLRRW